MRLWRIARAEHDALDGEGARLHGGRWNREGRAVVYAASSAPLAVLELLVHVDVEDLPGDLVLMEIAVPADVGMGEVGVERLPGDWNAVADHPACIRLGEKWLTSLDTLLLQVPSAVLPRESNVLINPVHPEMRRVEVVGREAFAFDPRLA
jgi:RES domain-containing protein